MRGKERKGCKNDTKHYAVLPMFVQSKFEAKFLVPIFGEKILFALQLSTLLLKEITLEQVAQTNAHPK